jgi:hydroxymethylbilane synthase
MTHEIRIGTRKSALAIAQAEIAAAALRRRAPAIQTRLVLLSTAGDRDLLRPASELPPGAFTTDIAAALAAGQIDLAVHSAKDLPIGPDPLLPIRSVLRRADPRDAIVSPHGTLLGLPPGARIGTSSPNRAAQLRRVRPDLIAVPVRGPVDRRLELIGRGSYDAMLLAAAGLDRLGRGRDIDRIPTRWVLPAPAQGALALQIRTGDHRLAALLRRVRHGNTWAAVKAERAFLRAAGLRADAPVAALARVRSGRLILTGLLGLPNGRLIRRSLRGPRSLPTRLGVRLARRLLRELREPWTVHVA